MDLVVGLLRELWGNTLLDDTSLIFTPYVLYLTQIQKRFLTTINSAITKKNKMADTSQAGVCSKFIISQFLFIIEQHTWYQIEAKSLSFAISSNMQSN